MRIVRFSTGEEPSYGVLTGEGCAAMWILREPDVLDTVTVARLPVTGAPRLSPNPPPRPR